MAYLWIAIGSAFGGVLRFWFSGIAAQKFGDAFPWGTILVNVTGCFLIGFLDRSLGVEGRVPPAAAHTRDFLMIGLLGGYTTFSAFSLQTLHLAREGQWVGAGGNVVLSVSCCLIAVWLGHLCAGIAR